MKLLKFTKVVLIFNIHRKSYVKIGTSDIEVLLDLT